MNIGRKTKMFLLRKQREAIGRMVLLLRVYRNTIRSKYHDERCQYIDGKFLEWEKKRGKVCIFGVNYLYQIQRSWLIHNLPFLRSLVILIPRIQFTSLKNTLLELLCCLRSYFPLQMLESKAEAVGNISHLAHFLEIALQFSLCNEMILNLQS